MLDLCYEKTELLLLNQPDPEKMYEDFFWPHSADRRKLKTLEYFGEFEPEKLIKEHPYNRPN